MEGQQVAPFHSENVIIMDFIIIVFRRFPAKIAIFQQAMFGPGWATSSWRGRSQVIYPSTKSTRVTAAREDWSEVIQVCNPGHKGKLTPIYSYIFLYFPIYFLYFPIYSYIFLYVSIFSYMFLYFPIYSYIFLYFPIYSYIFLYFPIFSYIFIYFPVFFYIFLYILIFSYIFQYFPINLCYFLLFP